MNVLTTLVTFLPRLRTPLQLSGLLVVAAAVVMTRSVEPDSIHANVSLGAVGVLLVVFGQLFHFLGTSIPARQRGLLLVTMFVVFCIFIIALIAATSYFYLNASTNVVLMDSPARVYSPSDRNQYRLNGSTLSEILDDLPVNIIHAPTFPDWVVSRCEQVRRRNPVLVVIHQSAFCREEETTADCHESESELIDFFRCMRDTRTRFLVYTRYVFGAAVLVQAENEVPEMKGRMFPFSMTRRSSETEYTTFDFSEPLIRRDLKQRVRELLQKGSFPITAISDERHIRSWSDRVPHPHPSQREGLLHLPRVLYGGKFMPGRRDWKRGSERGGSKMAPESAARALGWPENRRSAPGNSFRPLLAG